MEFETVKKNLEKGLDGNEILSRFFEDFIMQGLGLHVELIEQGRLLCSMKIPVRFLNPMNVLHGGGTASLVDLVGSAVIHTYGLPTGVSVEITVSYLDTAFADEEIEIEGRALRVGKTVAVVNVEFRKKKTARIFAQARHTKCLPPQTRM
ncbi:Calcium-dependent protein kinase 2 isoform 1 [Hibiscus syriacus]|uniref:Acyl-coenzyme A thioesterase 13 n=1 Tax=Hibiscus syriacus TaxID=106335 RepID=A0A6A2ZSQ1_HIBSY|nr:acyl-coenzyme A thioesterase 13-like [Hibiscus syriacus]KAE8694964.1 Calcium-dependent protein kinase 2 isoform 1 [Hibiscus syriacus]